MYGYSISPDSAYTVRDIEPLLPLDAYADHSGQAMTPPIQSSPEHVGMSQRQRDRIDVTTSHDIGSVHAGGSGIVVVGVVLVGG
jgi:hypothetical protein